MKKGANREIYPKEIDVYLENNRKSYGTYAMKSLFEEDIYMDYNQRKKDMKI